MSSLTNINNNSSVINVGRTTPVNPGQQTADKSIPVVIASDQSPIPVVEQNKIQSEVALSLLGIPRAEVALGIFADVNTYDVNPTEWASEPAEYTENSSGDGWGVKHLPEEAGALIEAPKDKFAVLTSKRFFRYQPGRVSAATFGVKSTKSPSSTLTSFDLNPSIRKYGIFDKYDGYYWETRANGVGDNFSVVRRTQSLLRNNPLQFGNGQTEDHGLSGKAPNVYKEEPNAIPTATAFLTDNRFDIIETAFAAAVIADTNVANLSEVNKAKCKRDMDLAMDAYILDLQYGGNAHSIVNATTYRMALLVNSTAEVTIHTQLAIAIRSALNSVGETTARDKVYVPGTPATGLATWTINAVTGTGTQPTQAQINAANYGSRSAISTIFSIYSKFYGYLGSEYTVDANLSTVIQSTAYVNNSATLSPSEIKYRCLRDITYIMNGYAEDLEFGGNASTIYNAKRYYFNGSQLYSQGVSGATGEIRRHTFIRKLLTDATNISIPVNTTPPSNVSFASLANLFPNVFNATLRTKMTTLSNIIIQNFSNEYTGDIEYGSGGNFGDLVVLRDGLIMTHAAAFDPSLLKKTKNVVAKPEFVLRTTATGAFSTAPGAINTNITIPTAAAANITKGMTVTCATAVTPGTYVTSVNTGTGEIGISIPLTSAITNAPVSFGKATLEVAEQTYIVGQYVNFYGTSLGASANGLTANKLYKIEKVRGTKGNVITLSDALEKKFKATITNGTTLILADAADAALLGPGVRIEGKGLADDTHIVSGSGVNWVISPALAVTVTPPAPVTLDLVKVAMISPDLDPAVPTLIYINPNVPFVFPNNYFVGNSVNPGDEPFTIPDGLFPLLYTRNGTLPATAVPTIDKVGFIDTSLVSALPLEIRGQIDTVNLIYNNWVKQNVDPRYYGVYEFRIPRSRFSTDQLNGLTNKTVYSDFSTGEAGSGKVYPGMPVTSDGAQIETKSVWDIDFTKVTMLKVEFSWYGAVGALFLAYVPVGNGEARWVRVHHLRASNQLKISSLGNATLPITYLVYGGGSVSRLGILDNTAKGYTKSNHIVKYGASYYIDGGDRGTVRLYSFSSGVNTNVYGSKYTLPSTGVSVVYDAAFGASGASYIQLPSSIAGFPSNYLYFMKAKVLTNSRADQNVQVIWVDTVNNRLYLNKGSLNSTSNIVLISSRPSVIFGLKAKENILNSVGKGVRNRVQVYPTKLSTSSVTPEGVTISPKVKLQLLKTPLYQEQVTTSGSYTLSESYQITPNNFPLPTTTTPVTSANYLNKDGIGIYGWFRSSVGTVFGYLYREAAKYYFTLLETYSEPVILNPGTAFLPDGRFGFDGSDLSASTVSEGSVQKERLSSVFISTQIQSPIPETGTEVATFFLKEGSDLFDLLSYFDYNKDYLSFPLTNKIESIYLTASSVQSSTTVLGVPTSVAEVNSSLTWEEQ